MKKLTYEELLVKNEKLIYHIARQLNKEEYFEDLVQVGKISLYQSYLRYDETIKQNIMDYANYNIRYAMMNFLSENSRLIKIKSYQKNKNKKDVEHKVVSTNIPKYDNSEIEFGDTLVDTVEDDSIDINPIKKAMKKLTPKQQMIINLKYGFDTDSGTERTLEEVGQILGISKQAVSQTCNKAIEELKKIMNQ